MGSGSSDQHPGLDGSEKDEKKGGPGEGLNSHRGKMFPECFQNVDGIRPVCRRNETILPVGPLERLETVDPKIIGV